jgi:hypothetical protein
MKRGKLAIADIYVDEAPLMKPRKRLLKPCMRSNRRHRSWSGMTASA